MVWLQFLLSSAVVVYAAIKLAEYGDIIAVRTGLGGLFVGTIFLAGATSLPELIASISAFQVGYPNLAAGNFFGSNMVNMMLLALVDLINYQVPLLRRIAVSHALTAALTTILMLVAIISILDGVDLKIGWVGVDSLVLIGLYFGGIWLIQRENRRPVEPVPASEPAADFPGLRRGVIGFSYFGRCPCRRCAYAGKRQHRNCRDHRPGHGFYRHRAAQPGDLAARAVCCPGRHAHERLRHGRGQLAWFQRF